MPFITFIILSVYLYASPTRQQFFNTSIWHGSKYEETFTERIPTLWSLRAHRIIVEDLQWVNDVSVRNSFFPPLWEFIKYMLINVKITYVALASWVHRAPSLTDDTDEDIAPHNKKRKLCLHKPTAIVLAKWLIFKMYWVDKI